MTTWNRTGTVSVTTGSPTVTGAGVSWSNVQPGDAFHGPDGEIYEVSSVTGSTITLVENYGGSTASGASYAIQPTRGVLVPLRQQLADLIAQANSILADEPLRAANNLSDLTNVATARENLGVPLNNIAITGGTINGVAIGGGTINGVAIGGTTPATVLNVDNIRIDGNTLSSTDTNGNIVLAPNGTGNLTLGGGVFVSGTVSEVANGGAVDISFAAGTGAIRSIDPTVNWQNLDIGAAQIRLLTAGGERVLVQNSDATFGVNILPSADSTLNLGSASAAWATAYLDAILPVGADVTIRRVGGTNVSPIVDGIAKAWVNFDGTGTPTARGSLNVSSLVDGGTGIYTVNYTTAMADANYAVTDGVQIGALASADNGGLSFATPLASSVQAFTASAGALADPAYVGISVQGDLA